MAWHLAQINVGRLRVAIDHPLIAEFVAGLDAVNRLAEASDGFVWRLQTEDGDATAIRISPDERVIVNVSVWTSLDALRAFVFRSGHSDFLRRRREWFEPYPSAATALWWIPAGHLPGVPEAIGRLADLDARGPTADAFGFRNPFPPSG